MKLEVVTLEAEDALFGSMKTGLKGVQEKAFHGMMTGRRVAALPQSRLCTHC